MIIYKWNWFNFMSSKPWSIPLVVEPAVFWRQTEHGNGNRHHSPAVFYVRNITPELREVSFSLYCLIAHVGWLKIVLPQYKHKHLKKSICFRPFYKLSNFSSKIIAQSKWTSGIIQDITKYNWKYVSGSTGLRKKKPSWENGFSFNANLIKKKRKGTKD